MEAIEAALQASSVDGRVIVPPSPDELELDTKEWGRFKKLLTDNHAKWKGGKKQHFEFPFDPSDLLAQLQRGERPCFKRDFHYFPTPDPVIDQMANIIIPLFDGRFLEPSAGRAAIYNRIQAEHGGRHHNQHWDFIEIEPVNRQHLADQGITPIWDNFDTFKRPVEGYDMIYANPPFKRDLPHVLRMITMLRKHGCIVTVLPESFEKKHAAQVEKIRARFEHIQFHAVDKGAFKESGTGCATTILSCHFKKPVQRRR